MPSKRKKEIKTTGEPPEQVTVPTQEDINNANRTMLVHLAVKMDGFARREDMSKVELTVSENRPLKPVYPYEGGDPVGLMQKGPRKLVITILDYEHDGHIRGTEEAW